MQICITEEARIPPTIDWINMLTM